MDFETEVVLLIKRDLPDNYRLEALPETWRSHFVDDDDMSDEAELTLGEE